VVSGSFDLQSLIRPAPFVHENQERLFPAMRFSPPNFRDDFDRNANPFTAMLLEKDPAKRADFDFIKLHPFFKGLDFEAVLHLESAPIEPELGKGDRRPGKRGLLMKSLSSPQNCCHWDCCWSVNSRNKQKEEEKEFSRIRAISLISPETVVMNTARNKCRHFLTRSPF
jgi:hypothetical protein